VGAAFGGRAHCEGDEDGGLEKAREGEGGEFGGHGRNLSWAYL